MIPVQYSVSILSFIIAVKRFDSSVKKQITKNSRINKEKTTNKNHKKINTKTTATKKEMET
jgi:hypothetical protein